MGAYGRAFARIYNQEWTGFVNRIATYGIDDQTAIQVTDGAMEVISEGHWRLFAP